ncbi:MAG: type II toxin-antitoxin system VapC family toxin, partial [Verrucomicrobia bacterium]|nr:type II toxin-antitoxin system VapC family toxin [Verrucomicrobiota bacterium]
MKRPVLFDSDVLVDYLRGRSAALACVELHARAIQIPSIVMAELYAGVRGSRELEDIDRLMSYFPVVPV